MINLGWEFPTPILGLTPSMGPHDCLSCADKEQ